MSLHDRLVLSIANKELFDGSDEIIIGDRVEDRMLICKILKTKWPRRRIKTYIANELVEVIG